MNIAILIKEHFGGMPPTLGRFLNKVPYQYRPGIGKIYRERLRQMQEFQTALTEQKQRWVLEKFQKLVRHAYDSIPFYKHYYDSMGFHPSVLVSFEDIQRIPIVSKDILRTFDIEQRSVALPGRYIVNTGGSSGIPFSFYILPDSMGHEWAHMHSVWGKVGYTPDAYKLGFHGRNDIGKHLIKYDAIRNNFALNIYERWDNYIEELIQISRKYPIEYLHGYPSVIFEFAKCCEERYPQLLETLRTTLKGGLLGSEYPHSVYRDEIERIFEIPTVSWYGHTERAILAYEAEEKFLYEPFLTYGYTEAIPTDSKDDNYLVGTAYYNYASPLIRYNTEDLIAPVAVEDGILKSFKISSGRDGEFVIDRLGNRINLTGLIFGRHHALFNVADFIQVKQVQPGHVEIHFVAKAISASDAKKLFDAKNLDMDIDFIKRDAPIRTKMGKVNLLIRN